MSNRMGWMMLASLSCGLLWAGSAWGAISGTRDSGTFQKQYGAADVLNGVDGWTNVNGAGFTDNGGVLTFTTVTNAGGVWTWQNAAGDYWFDNVTTDTSFTIEVSVKVTNSGTAGFHGLNIGGLNGSDGTWLNVQSNGSSIGGLAPVTLESSINNSNAFQTYRLAYDADEELFYAWHGATLLNPAGSGGIADNFNKGILVGDASSFNTAGTVEIAYIRFDLSGAYAPVPEPASLALLTVACACMGWRRR